MTAAPHKSFVSLKRLAIRLGLPESWLHAEVRKGNIPFLQIGNRLRFNVAAVEQALIQRTATTAQGKGVIADQQQLAVPA